MYGLGLSTRIARYASNGSRPARGTLNCRARTIWNASPAAMYSCARRTIAM